jgi:broad specificity phosphatase PhoE
MTTFLLVRHGANDYLGHALAGRLPGVHLNAEGRRQVEALAECLAPEPIRALYTSPQDRARETAAPLARRLGLEPCIVEELAEVNFGVWPGKTLAELEQLSQWQRLHSCPSCNRAPGGETLLEAQVRIVRLVQRLSESCPGQTLALFSHSDLIKAGLCFYLGVPLDLCHRLEISPASVSAVQIGPDGPHILYINRKVACARPDPV